MSGRWLRGAHFTLNRLVRHTPHLGLIIETECTGGHRQTERLYRQKPCVGNGTRGFAALVPRAPRVLGESRRCGPLPKHAFVVRPGGGRSISCRCPSCPSS